MSDAELIQSLGGATALAKRLFPNEPIALSCRRTHNWIRRGIPAAIKVKFPEIFLQGRAAATAPQTLQAA
ncbi:MAG: hypothetical protein ACRCV9_09085 [Burkholderiaceae bacterium]